MFNASPRTSRRPQRYDAEARPERFDVWWTIAARLLGLASIVAALAFVVWGTLAPHF